MRSTGPAITAPRPAPRASLRAMGLTDDDISRPIVAVGSAWNEATPCNVHLTRLAGWAKEGVKAAGGTPREFATIAVTEGRGPAGEGRSRSSRACGDAASPPRAMVMAHGY